MTKENIKAFEITARTILEKQGAIGFNIFIENFFDSNVCIPKGANRHPYADVFHEAMEDTTKVIQFEDGHAGCDWTNLYIAKDRKHRIKPSEPEVIYEYIWIVQEHGTVKRTLKHYSNIEEIHSSCNIQGVYFPIEETKRVRK